MLAFTARAPARSSSKFTARPRSKTRPAEAYVAMRRALIPPRGRLGSETWRSPGLRLETEVSRDVQRNNSGRRRSGFATIGPSGPGGELRGAYVEVQEGAAAAPDEVLAWSCAIARRQRRSEGAQ